MPKLTEEQAGLLYRREFTETNPNTGKPLAAATHRVRLSVARRFYAWSLQAGFCKHNPFAEVQPVGRVNVGKKQLRIDEARRLESQGEVIARVGRGLVQTKQPDELLFFPSKGNPHRNYYWLQVRRLCRLAGVTEVCAHSLRGLHATLALEGGATADAVARALGHGSFAMSSSPLTVPTQATSR